MGKRLSGPMPWFKAYALPMIEGSVTQTMNDTQQLIWWKLVALARISKFGDGTLRHGEGIPMTTKWIAARLGYTQEQIEETVGICMRDKNHEDNKYRIRRWDDGTIELCNFLDYNPQSHPATLPINETTEEKTKRETRTQSILNRKYPESANLAVTEQVVVDGSTGEVLGKSQRLRDAVRLPLQPERG